VVATHVACAYTQILISRANPAIAQRQTISDYRAESGIGEYTYLFTLNKALKNDESRS
jgi:hypothetical protein